MSESASVQSRGVERVQQVQQLLQVGWQMSGYPRTGWVSPSLKEELEDTGKRTKHENLHNQRQ